MKVGAKTPWSRATRARMVLFVLRRLTLRCRNLNQVVAAGPKMAGGSCLVLRIRWDGVEHR